MWLRILLEADPVGVEWMQRFPGGVYLNDSTQITWHADWATTWDGGATAALKIPTLLEQFGGSLQAGVIAARQHDSATRLANLDCPSDSVVVEDSGYLDGERMQRRCAHGVPTIVSSRSAVVVFDEQGRRLDVLHWLRQHSGHDADRRVSWQGCWYRLVAIPHTHQAKKQESYDLTTTGRY